MSRVEIGGRTGEPAGLPVVIQGGMGIGVSGWRLARAVSLAGQLGVVSGVALDALVARRLQLGDPGGHLRRALGAFPVPAVAERVLARHFVPGGIGPRTPYRNLARPSLAPERAGTELAVVANFAEVHLAKEGHDGLVGINYLEKTQMANPAALYGAMLAGVDYVLVGAGIPAAFPRLVDSLAAGEPAGLSVDVAGGATAPLTVTPFAGSAGRPPRRPGVLAVVASHVLAAFLARDDRTRPDGFVVEGPVAGGHVVPPRGPLELDGSGEPVYGPRDVVDLERLRALGLPFWLAGGRAHPDAVREARAEGAAGVQVGSAFALCEESGLAPELRRAVVEGALAGTLRVRTDPVVSPTGFPFKVAELAGTLSDDGASRERRRVCDAGYLRQAYRGPDGRTGYRCPAEPVAAYLRKGGRREDTAGRCCLCNALLAAAGLGQRRSSGSSEPPIVTIGQDLSFLPALASGSRTYGAAEVVAYLLGGAA
ncbi:MAG TPA: nitronate monooxygenase [Acidimicrobiales bacterium]|nr:nitronate monooxygenase [Acidimicrobiales bacterium]